jgi:hypothetical protein
VRVPAGHGHFSGVLANVVGGVVVVVLITPVKAMVGMALTDGRKEAGRGERGG